MTGRPPPFVLIARVAAVVFALLSTSSATAVADVIATERPPRLTFEEEARLATGLVMAAESIGDAADSRDHRRVRMAALNVPRGHSPTSCLPPGPFRCTLAGFLVLDISADVTFSLRGTGEAVLQLNGKEVLRSEGDLGAAPGVTVGLYRGPNAFLLHYESPPDRDATLQVIWSQRGNAVDAQHGFPPEPIPPSHFQHDPAHPGLVEGIRLRRGRELFATHNCHRCHLPDSIPKGESLMPELSRDTPALVDVRGRFRPNWLFHWMLEPSRLRNDVAMPRVLGPDETAAQQLAADLVAFLTPETDSAADRAAADSADEPGNDEHVAAGEILYENLGCIACHRFTEPSEGDDFDRVSLHYVSEKYRAGALTAFLRDPLAHYRYRRMPDFRLTADEAIVLAAFLRRTGTGQLAEADLSRGNAERGRAAFAEQGCQSCHALQRDRNPHRGTPIPLTRRAVGNGCLATTPPATAPRFEFDAESVDAIGAFLAAPSETFFPDVAGEASQRLVAELRCGACHGRDGEANNLTDVVIEEGIQGLPPQRIPDLTWAGEKLHREWISKLIRGDLDDRARPWLAARMPAFPAYAKRLAAGLPAEHGFSGGPRPGPSFDPELANIGRRLTLQNGGYFCIECHATDKRPPISAFDHRGIDFPDIGDRLQFDYYLRWMKAPKRIDPATKMPEFAGKPKPDVLRGDAQRQFEAIWHYLKQINRSRNLEP